jgi:hypothetical protein
MFIRITAVTKMMLTEVGGQAATRIGVDCKKAEK